MNVKSFCSGYYRSPLWSEKSPQYFDQMLFLGGQGIIRGRPEMRHDLRDFLGLNLAFA